MATISAERPQFFEGQYLGADDLDAIVDYLRTSNARQNLGQHTWGIAVGLELVSQPISDTAVEYYVQPGVAVDGYGRIIVVYAPTRIEADDFVGIGSGNVDVWIRYDESEFSATRPGFNVCSATDEYARISESFKIVVGNKPSVLDRQSGVTVNDTLLVDARDALLSVNPEAPLLCDASVPHQQLPVEDETSHWLVRLGHVKWSSASNSFLPLVDPAERDALENGSGTKTPDQVYESLMAGRTKRRLIGVVAESLFAAEDLIRLRQRTAEPDPATTNDAVCEILQVQSADLFFCEGRLKPKELVWLEGNVRVKGDTRLLNGRLEFRDKEGRDYVDRTVAGVAMSPIVPALLQRSDGNSKGGTDLQVLLGKSTNGSNRFTIGNITFSGTDLCNLSVASENGVVIQDNGRVGVGTTNPDTVLTAPLTVRSLQETITENEGTDEEITYDIYRLQVYEAEDGTAQWQIDLNDTEGSARKSLNITETGLSRSRFFLQTGGNIGIGTETPSEQVHVRGDDPALFIDINSTSGLHNAELQFGSDGATEAGIFWSKSAQKLFIHHGGVNSLVANGARLGVGTDSPLTSMHIATGNDVNLTDSAGYLLLGDANGLNLVLDNNEIQARDNGVAAQLHLQVEGGDFSVHWNDPSEFRIRDNGDVGVGTNAPTAKLDVRGDIKMGSAGDLFAVAGTENLRTVVGRVSVSGGIEQGHGFSVVKGGNGDYTINFSPAFASHPVVVVSMYNEDEHIVCVRNVTSSSCQIRSRDMLGGNAGDLQNAAFTFIAIGER